MRTAIFTTQKTALTIQTSEKAQLVQMSNAAATTAPLSMTLSAGPNQVTVGAGVFKVVSTNAVTVTVVGNTDPAATPAVHILATANDKDGDWPDPNMSMVSSSVTSASLHSFFAIAGVKSL